MFNIILAWVSFDIKSPLVFSGISFSCNQKSPAYNLQFHDMSFQGFAE